MGVTVRTPEIDDEIIERLSKGEPMAVICRSEHMPTDRTVRRWQDDDADFASAIARAREDGFDAIAADCLEIADETGLDTKIGEDGKERPDTEWISRSKLRVETRLKLLAKWDPKRYGDAMTHKLADANGDKIEVDEVTRAARLAALAEQINRQRLGGDNVID